MRQYRTEITYDDGYSVVSSGLYDSVIDAWDAIQITLNSKADKLRGKTIRSIMIVAVVPTTTKV
jgi:hypothetical protein